MNPKLAQTSRLVLLSVFVVAAAGGPATAQLQTQACESQQSLEQLMETKGSLTPDDCRPVTITQIERDAGDLCVIDFSGAENGVVEDLLAVTRTEQWWIACEGLSDGVEQRSPKNLRN